MRNARVKITKGGIRLSSFIRNTERRIIMLQTAWEQIMTTRKTGGLLWGYKPLLLTRVSRRGL